MEVLQPIKQPTIQNQTSTMMKTIETSGLTTIKQDKRNIGQTKIPQTWIMQVSY